MSTSESISNKAGNATGGAVGQETLLHQATTLATHGVDYAKSFVVKPNEPHTLGELVNESRDLTASVLEQVQRCVFAFRGRRAGADARAVSWLEAQTRPRRPLAKLRLRLPELSTRPADWPPLPSEPPMSTFPLSLRRCEERRLILEQHHCHWSAAGRERSYAGQGHRVRRRERRLQGSEQGGIGGRGQGQGCSGAGEADPRLNWRWSLRSRSLHSLFGSSVAVGSVLPSVAVGSRACGAAERSGSWRVERSRAERRAGEVSSPSRTTHSPPALPPVQPNTLLHPRPIPNLPPVVHRQPFAQPDDLLLSLLLPQSSRRKVLPHRQRLQHEWRDVERLFCLCRGFWCWSRGGEGGRC